LAKGGRGYRVASATPPAPGALSRDPSPPAAGAEASVRPQPVATTKEPVVASAPVPRSAPQPKQGEVPASEQKPTTIAGLIGSWLGGPKTEATPAREQAVRPGANTDPATKPEQ